MSEPFSLDRSRCATISDPALRQEIETHTGSAAATSRILSSIERFGGDPAIRRYEMTPTSRGRASRTAGGGGVAWTVRAVRDEANPPTGPWS